MQQRIIIKIGSNVITDNDGFLNKEVMLSIVKQIVELKKLKIEVVLVSSGAVAAGRSRLDSITIKEEKLQKRQLLAAVGQVRLMEVYSELFQNYGYYTAQVLATKEDFRDRQHYLCMRECFITLLHDNIIPIVNENDVIAVSELMFTDNDELAGFIASMLDVNKLFILTSVDGLFDKNPNDDSAKLIEKIEAGSEKLDRYAMPRSQKSIFGRGGMHTKCKIASHLSSLGITTHIANGKKSNVIIDLINGKSVGTKFEVNKKISGIKKWVSHGKGFHKGSVTINIYAEEVLKQKDQARSLLPVGITAISGEFVKGDIIEIKNLNGDIIGYGIAQYGSQSAQEKIGKKKMKPLIHYNYLYMSL
jgi:glutamate 5-kinase